MPPDDPASTELRTAASQMELSSPAWPTVTHHRLRQEIALGERDAARNELDVLLPGMRASAQESVLNLFLSQRFELARNLDDALEFSPRYPVAEAFGEGESLAQKLPEGTPETLLDADSVEMFNRGLPLAMLAHAATSATLPEHLRRQLTIVGWSRAVLIERWDVARELAAPLRGFYPDLGRELDRWQSATTDEDRRFAGAYLFLRHPGLKPQLRSGLEMRTELDKIDSYFYR